MRPALHSWPSEELPRTCSQPKHEDMTQDVHCTTVSTVVMGLHRNTPIAAMHDPGSPVRIILNGHDGKGCPCPCLCPCCARAQQQIVPQRKTSPFLQYVDSTRVGPRESMYSANADTHQHGCINHPPPPFFPSPPPGPSPPRTRDENESCDENRMKSHTCPAWQRPRQRPVQPCRPPELRPGCRGCRGRPPWRHRRPRRRPLPQPPPALPLLLLCWAPATHIKGYYNNYKFDLMLVFSHTLSG